MSHFLSLRASRLRNRYLLMRHAHSEANRSGRIVSSPERGRMAFGLSPRGREQLRMVVAGWDWPQPTGILHSDFLRTTQTAAGVARRFGLAMQGETRLRERHFGRLEGESDASYAGVWRRDAVDAGHRQHGVEPVEAVAERMLAVLEELERGSEGEMWLLVSHGDPLQILLTALEGRELRHHRDRPVFPPAGVMALPPIRR